MRDLTAGEPARASRTGELGSEGGSYGELTQSARAGRGDNAELEPRTSPLLTIALVAGAVLLLLLVVWFGSSLSELLSPG